MKTKTLLLTVFSGVLCLAANAQNTKNTNTTYPNDEIPFLVIDGVKTNAKTNTPLLFVGLKDVVTGSSPAEMALNWVSQNKERLKLNPLFDVMVYFEHHGAAGHTIRLQQELQGVPVYKSEIVVHISPNNEVTYVTNTYDPTVDNVSTTPAISISDAFVRAKEAIHAQGNVAFEAQELMIYNRGEATRLVYKVTVEPQAPSGSWEVLVDAQNGAIITTGNRACNHKGEAQTSNSGMLPPPPPANGTGNVFLPDPLSVAQAQYAAPYNDNNDAANASLNATMSSVTLLDLNFTGSVYELVGPYAENLDFESPFNGDFSQASSNFNFNRNDDAFEAVNCYYHIDNSMRYINETLLTNCMPFQYTGGVNYDPHGLNGADNSYYLGGSGRLAFGEGGVDDAEDADVVLHELGHGIHDWLTGGNLSQVNGLSEGSGDYWATSYSRSLNQWTVSDPEYNWMFSWDGHNEWWNGRITNYTALYPGGLTGSIHTDGQIWATCLMRIYDQIGRAQVDKAFLEGLAMTGSSTSQQDAAIAVRQAAIDMNYSCADVDVFTQEFIATGYQLPPLPQNTSSETSTICPGQSVTVNGTVYDANNPTGTEVIVGGGANGCDSTITVNLNVVSVNAAMTVVGSTFTANQSGAQYQWVDCDNDNAAITGETNQTFVPTTSGNYAVTVTMNGCSETSACQLFDNSGLDEISNNTVLVYPNPSNGIFNIELLTDETHFDYTINSVDGRVIQHVSNATSSKFTIDLSAESAGVYFLRLNGNANVIQLVLETK